MTLTLACVLMYWLNPPGRPAVDIAMLIGIGFFIFGPFMLIGVYALDIAAKKLPARLPAFPVCSATLAAP